MHDPQGDAHEVHGTKGGREGLYKAKGTFQHLECSGHCI